jgi:hypothetical protein
MQERIKKQGTSAWKISRRRELLAADTTCAAGLSYQKERLW